MHHRRRPDVSSPRRNAALVFIVLAWVYLVYVWRLCSPAIRHQVSPNSHPVRLASRSTGIGLLVGFNILWLMTMWCYLRVILTPPGFVNDYADKESMPSPLQSEWIRDNIGGPYLGPEKAQGSEGDADADGDDQPIDPTLPAIVGPIGAGVLAASAEEGQQQQQQQQQPDSLSAAPTAIDESSSQTQTIRPPPPAAFPPSSQQAAPSLPAQPSNGTAPATPWSGLIPRPVRQPPHPDYAPLARSNRYCHRCRHVKTPRAHHCRHCGRCVMRMDHHCPWVGGCVGARNHKVSEQGSGLLAAKLMCSPPTRCPQFFWHFLLWVTMLEIFTLISSAILFSRGISSSPAYATWTVDGFVISLFPICGLFILFTSPLLVTHSWLLCVNQSTIEHLEVARIQRREDILLQSYFAKGGAGFEQETKGKGQWSLEALRGKKKIKAEWEREWGHLRYETNLWKVEEEEEAGETKSGEASGRRYVKQPSRLRDGLVNWRFMMGSSPWMWILPLGRSASDGREYPVNPRHGEYGQWRTRSQWPEELR